MKKILIAEDDKFLANAYRVKLTKVGFDVHLASDGNEAIKALDTFIPDLIILDLVMPVKDGFTTLKEIKENSKLNAIPVVISSNLGQKEDVDKAMKLGAKAFIVKSDISLSELIDKINSIIK